MKVIKNYWGSDTMKCIFCKIISGELKADILYEDEKILIFKDIEPAAPIHLLAIPRKHIKNAFEINETADVITHIFKKIAELKDKLNISNGFRIVNNCGEDAGQTVHHIHFHILAGRKLNWPPG